MPTQSSRVNRGARSGLTRPAWTSAAKRFTPASATSMAWRSSGRGARAGARSQ